MVVPEQGRGFRSGANPFGVFGGLAGTNQPLRLTWRSRCQHRYRFDHWSLRYRADQRFDQPCGIQRRSEDRGHAARDRSEQSSGTD